MVVSLAWLSYFVLPADPSEETGTKQNMEDSYFVLPADPSEETGTKQNMEDFLTVISNLASGRRAGSVHVMSSSSKIPSTEQCIGPFKAMLDWVDEKQPKLIEDGHNLKASTASKASHHWRGNLFWWIETKLVLDYVIAYVIDPVQFTSADT